MNYGFVKVASAIPHVKVADCAFNAAQIEKGIIIADGRGVEIIVFPELCLTGYTCGDLFAHQLLLENAEIGLMQILNNTRQLDIISIVGMPVALNGILLNAAVVIQKGKILGIVPKTYLPNYKEFYEKRWFTSSTQVDEKSVRLCGQNIPMSSNLLFDTSKTTFGIEICEDLWAPIPPSSSLALQGAEIIFNLSADNEGVGKHSYLCSLIAQQSARCIAGYVFSSCGFGESTTDVVFAGNALIYENGTQLNLNKRFSFDEQIVISEIDVERLRGMYHRTSMSPDPYVRPPSFCAARSCHGCTLSSDFLHTSRRPGTTIGSYSCQVCRSRHLGRVGFHVGLVGVCTDV